MKTDKKVEVDQDAERSNQPDKQRPAYISTENSSDNRVESDAKHLNRNDFGYGDYGSEEARADGEKGNDGHAGHMPNTENQDEVPGS